MADIQFSLGINEPVVPDVRLTRSPDGRSGTATFLFEQPEILDPENTTEVTGMYMVDDEIGQISTSDVKGIFVNGRATRIKALYTMKSPEEWDRFMLFMNKYAEEHGLGLSRSSDE